MNSTVAVTTPAEVTALSTLDRVKLELRITGSDDDALLEAKLGEASSDIALRCAPSLRRETLTEIFYPDRGPICLDKLLLSRWPVASIATVTLDDEVVDGDEYRVDGERGLLYRLSTTGYPSQWSFSKSLAIDYAAGYLLPGEDGRDLPPSLEAAAIDLVSSYWASRGRDPLLRREENVGVSRFDYWVGAVGASGNLPPGVMSKIEMFAPVRA